MVFISKKGLAGETSSVLYVRWRTGIE